MRKTGISFKQIYKLTKRFFKKIKYKEKKKNSQNREVLQELKILVLKLLL
jgi:hypothetical protein